VNAASVSSCEGGRTLRTAKGLGLWVGGAANLVGGSGEIVVGVLKLNIGTEQEPVGAGFAEGHSDAAGVHASSRADDPVKLHVSMAADHRRGAKSFEDGQEAVFGREGGKDFGVVARCGMAEKDVAKAGNLHAACWRPAL
jgi:hypothetical protein